MLAKIASVALIVSAIAGQAVAYDDDDSLFSGWSKDSDDAFASTVAERMSAHAHIPTPSTIPVIPAVHVASPVLSVDSFNGSVQVVPAIHHHDHHHVKAFKSIAHAKAHSAKMAEAHLQNVTTAVKHNDAAIEKTHEDSAVATTVETSAELLKKFEALVAESKDLAKKLVDAQNDVSKTTHEAQVAAEKAFTALTNQEKEAHAARIKSRAEKKAARITAHNDAVKGIQKSFTDAKSAVENKYADSNKTEQTSLQSVRAKIAALKVQITKKKAEELAAERKRVSEQLRKAEEEVRKFTGALHKLDPVDDHHHDHHHGHHHHHLHNGQRVVLPVAPGVDMALNTSAYRPLGISALPARLASYAASTNPAKAMKIAKITRDATHEKSHALNDATREAKRAQFKAAKSAFKARILRAKAVEAQHDYVQASATENSVQNAIRHTVKHIAGQAAVPIDFAEVAYSN